MAVKSTKRLTIFGVLVASLALTSLATTMEDQEKECADQLTSLASCIPFVSGTAKKPTAECCEDTQKVKASKPKCLCVLIKESTDPSLGLPVSTTLALQMPSACNIDANISDCPSILNLSPDSPDAKIFKEAGAGSSSPSNSSSTSSLKSPPASTSSASSSSPQSDSESDSKTTTPSSNDAAKLKISKLEGSLLAMMLMMASFARILE